MRNFKQISLDEWQPVSNYPIAVVDSNPEELEKELKIKFDETYDDLDYFKYAVLEISSDKKFLLLRYRGNPSKGTEIWSSSGISNISGDLDLFLKVMNIDSSRLSWVRKEG